MSTVYITEQGAVVRQSSQHLVVTKGNERIMHIPLIKTERLLIFGNVQLTTQAIDVLLKEGIDVAFLTNNAKLRGRLVATESKNIFQRLAQYERHNDDDFQLDMQRALVRGKLRNGRAVILLYQKNNPAESFADEIATLDQMLDKLDRQITANSLMGCEGTGTATYFRAYGRMFRKELRFETRTKRPPKDPVNALLSLGYTLLTNEVLSLVIAKGLDPYLGFLHEVVYGRPSLALDIVEEFRHPLIDRFTLNLFNNQLFTAEDFQPVENKGVYFTPEAFKNYLRLYEQRMREPLKLSTEETPSTYRELIRDQVNAMSKSIKTREVYQPYAMKW
jgi:CRISPR-associated protein Cas1